MECTTSRFLSGVSFAVLVHLHKGAAVPVPVPFPRSCSDHQAEAERELESLVAQFSHPGGQRPERLICTVGKR